MTGPSMMLAEHVATFDSRRLGGTTIAAAKRALVDGIGVMLAASGLSPDVAPFVALAKDAGEGQASLFGHDQRVPASFAALANGAMAHALDYEDAYDAAPCHPNAALIPALLALAETHGPVSGRELLAAIALGCDLTCRLALAVRRPLEEGGWYPPPIFGGFGAVAAAGRVLRLDARQMADAFTLMLMQTCPGEIKYAPETVLRAVRESFPARAAVEAALLARGGVRGFDRPFEGKAGFFALYSGGLFDPDLLTGALGERFLIEDLSFKRWPACRGTHAYIELAQRLRAEIGDWRRIREIGIEGGPDQVMLAEPEASKKRPSTAIDAKFSLPFTIASTFLHGDIGLASFSEAALADENVRALAAHTRFTRRPDWGRAHAASGRLVIALDDGSTRIVEELVALGGPKRPLSDQELAAKFHECAGLAAHSWSGDRAASFLGAVARIECDANSTVALALAQDHLQALASSRCRR